MPDNTVTISLTNAEALVLFEFLARVEADGPWRAEHPAEPQVLWKVEAVLEKALVEQFSPDYDQLLARARTEVLGT